MGDESDADRGLAAEHGWRDRVGFGLELGRPVFFGVVDTAEQLVIDVDVEFGASPFILAPEGQFKAERLLAARRHEIAEVVAVAGITVENTLGAAFLRKVSFHQVVGFRLLLTRLNFVHGAPLKFLARGLLALQFVQILLIIRLSQRQPIHHIARIVNLVEWLQLSVYGIVHRCRQSEVQRLALDRNQLRRKVRKCLRMQYRSLVQRQFSARSILSETAVVSQQRLKILRSRLHTQQHRSVHYCHILRHVRHLLDPGFHRQRNLHALALLPLSPHAYEAILFKTFCVKAYTLDAEILAPLRFTQFQSEFTLSPAHIDLCSF